MKFDENELREHLCKPVGKNMQAAIVQIKHQMEYVRKNAEKAKIEFPDNRVAFEQWNSMYQAYEIALQILNGEEL